MRDPVTTSIQISGANILVTSRIANARHQENKRGPKEYRVNISKTIWECLLQQCNRPCGDVVGHVKCQVTRGSADPYSLHCKSAIVNWPSLVTLIYCRPVYYLISLKH